MFLVFPVMEYVEGREDRWFVGLSYYGYLFTDEVLLCVHVGLLCVQENPADRPRMSYVVFVLENGSTTLPTPNRPAYFARQSSHIEQIRNYFQTSVNRFTLTEIEGRWDNICFISRYIEIFLEHQLHISAHHTHFGKKMYCTLSKGLCFV